MRKGDALELYYPVRIRVSWETGTLPGLVAAAERWGLEHLGFNRMAAGFGQQARDEALLYFRDIAEAGRLLAAFPELKLSDMADQDPSRAYSGKAAPRH